MSEVSEEERTRAQITGHRRGKFKDFFRVARLQRAGDIDFSLNEEGDSEHEGSLNVEKLIEEKPLDEANSVSSRVRSGGSLESEACHILALDIDYDAWLGETSTFGHHHLIINHFMPWSDYKKLLEVMAEVGLIQPGYAHASIEREATWLRTPWTRKPGYEVDDEQE